MQDQTPQNETIVIRKLIAATPEEVFMAWTDPESMRDWMMGRADMKQSDVHLDVRPGGNFRITMKGNDGNYEHTGKYLIVEPPSRLVFTWISKSTHQQETIVTVELKPRGTECELTLTHEKLPSKEEASNHQDGWTRIAELLAQHLIKRRSQ
jgi:uncharacterized protein YndB with AHSA1/START domain